MAYITENRTILEALKSLEGEGFLKFSTYSEDWIIRAQRNTKLCFIFGYAFDANSQSSAMISADKVATYMLLSENNVSSVPHFLLSTVIKPEVNVSILDELFKKFPKLVIKPTEGYRGENVALVDSSKEALSFVRDKYISSWAASPLIDIDRELRIVMFEGKAQLAYEKSSPKIVNNLRMFNLNLGASSRHVDVKTIDQNILDLAEDAMRAIGLKLGAVDIVFDKSNHAYVLEINSAFSLDHFAGMSTEGRHIVVEFYKFLLKHLLSN